VSAHRCEQMVSGRRGLSPAGLPLTCSRRPEEVRQRAPGAAGHLLTFIPGCGSMLDAAAQRGCADKTAADKLPSNHPKEPAMHIGEQQEELEILPTEEEQQQPLVLREREPQQHPEDALA
jgi:hypothetical protein